MTTDDHLRDFFTYDIGRVLNYSALELLLDMPPKTLRFWAKYKTRGLTEAQRRRVEVWAKSHGYKEDIQYNPIVFF